MEVGVRDETPPRRLELAPRHRSTSSLGVTPVTGRTTMPSRAISGAVAGRDQAYAEAGGQRLDGLLGAADLRPDGDGVSITGVDSEQ